MKNTLKNAYIYDLLSFDRVIKEIGTEVNVNLDKYRLTTAQNAAVLNDLRYKASGYGKERIVSNVESGKIIFVSAPKVPLPAWCMQLPNGEIVAICNVFSKVRQNREGNLAYQAKEIFGLTVVAYILRSFYVNEPKFIYNNKLIQSAGIMYARIILRALDMMFAISASANTREYRAIAFLILRFYFRRVMEKESSIDQEISNITSIISRIVPGASAMSVTDILPIVEDFPDDAFQNIDTLMKALSTSFPSLSRLETNLLIRKMIVTFGEKFALILESPQYLIAYLVSSAYSANLLKDLQIVNVVGNKEIANLAADVFNLDTNK
jgi:hypothetical protein